MASRSAAKDGEAPIEELEHVCNDARGAQPQQIKQRNAGMYFEALQRFPNDESMDAQMIQRLKHKIDRRILPLLGICYFFYVRSHLIYHQIREPLGRSHVFFRYSLIMSTVCR